MATVYIVTGQWFEAGVEEHEKWISAVFASEADAASFVASCEQWREHCVRLWPTGPTLSWEERRAYYRENAPASPDREIPTEGHDIVFPKHMYWTIVAREVGEV